MVEIFYPDKNGKISFSKEELQELLNRVHDHGYEEGYNKGLAAHSPYWWTPLNPFSNAPSITTSDKTTVTYPSNGDVTLYSSEGLKLQDVAVSTPDDSNAYTICMTVPPDNIGYINNSVSMENTEEKEQKNNNDKVDYDWHEACAPKANKFPTLDADKYRLDKLFDFNDISSDFSDFIKTLTGTNKN